METSITVNELVELGLNKADATQLLEQINIQLKINLTAEETWQALSQNVLGPYPFNVHLFIFDSLFPARVEHPELAPAVIPTVDTIATANISIFMSELETQDIKNFHHYTVKHFQNFWQRVIHKLQIKFSKPPISVCEIGHDVENIKWFPGAKLNIAESCFNATPEACAFIYANEQRQLQKLTYNDLNQLSNRIANGLIALGFQAGDPIAIAMPMNHYAVAIYLGIIKMGGVVVSIADSFSSQEIAVRITIAKTKAIFTQETIQWGDKEIALYQKIKGANTPTTIILNSHGENSALRQGDILWEQFLSPDKNFNAVPCDPMAPCNILFSSGTTGEPKAIPWNHTTAIKAASDAYFHQNIKPGDVLTWPTNLGWMMGPWLIFAALINRASIGLYADHPKDRKFGEFIQNAKVTMLGVVPTLVANWRQSGCMEKLDWSNIKVFSSSGESSNPEDMLYLMSLAGYKPVIEYCGGTEIGGAYISSTVVENNYPSLFSTPTMGLDFIIINSEGNPTDVGEVAIIPPSLGLSENLLNADHHRVYYADMAKYQGKILRRHGDQLKRFANGYYMVLGRVDDTMNLGGIKVSTAEIEHAVSGVPNITEVAAIAVSPHEHGPSQLVIFAVSTGDLNRENIIMAMQKKINAFLNPLFKIHDVVFVKELPKTASNKIMRRTLRKSYLEKSKM